MIWYAQLVLLAPTLYDQSISRLLQRDFPTTQFLLVDANTRELIGGHWVAPERPVPMGSLVKPFSALSGAALKFRCNPLECWLPAGHGEMDLAHAIAESCNSYFLQLNAAAIPEQVRTMALRFHLPDPHDYRASTLTGIGTQWPISPRQIATAYAVLASDGSATGIREGMRMSAKYGTAKALRSDALAKTGTASCSHAQRAPGDGYVVVLYPASSPRYVLLVQVHGVSGAVAASTAGEMLKVIRDGK
jgi:cell division protein FtsI/penicillin-binding protein 2